MKFLEKDLEEIIFNSDRIKLIEKGLPIYGKLKRQLKIGNYGIADLVTFDKFNDGIENYLNITIYELKQDKIGISAFFQAISYAKGIQVYLDSRKPFLQYKLNITLIGKEVDTSGSLCYLPSLFCISNNYGYIEEINFYTYKYGIDGIEFTPENWYKLTKTGF